MDEKLPVPVGKNQGSNVKRTLHLDAQKEGKMSLKKNTDRAIKYHLSGIEKLKNGAKDWIACGESLIRIKQELKHGEFGAYIEKNIPFTQMQATKYMRFARQGPALLEIMEQHESLSQNEALKLLPAANKDDIAYVGSLDSANKERDSDDWHTPMDVIEAAKQTMGSIDLDPFSSNEANSRIQAKTFFSKEDDALEIQWDKAEASTAFINPPYGRKIINKAIDKVIEQYQAGAFKEAILLVNNATDTLWFHNVLPFVSAVCFTKGRIAFLSPAEDGVLKHVSGNTRGQVLFYFGKNAKKFINAYKDLGWVLEVN